MIIFSKYIYIIKYREGVVYKVNIQVQCCGIMILIFLIYLTMRYRRVGLYKETIFLRVVILALVSVTLDVSTIIAITYREYIPQLFLELLCKTYNSSLIFVGYSSLNYAFADIYSEKVYRGITKKYSFFALVACVVVYILPIQFYQEGRNIYTYDGSVEATYFFAVLFILHTLYYIIRKRYLMSEKRRNAIMVWLLIWSVAAVIQALHNELLIVGFASALGMMVLFYMLENPEVNIDKQFGCFNSSALLSCLRQAFERGESYSIILISFTYLQDKNFENGKISQNIKRISDVYMENKHVRVFKTIETKLILMIDSKEVLDEVLGQLRNNAIIGKKSKFVSLSLQPHVYVMEDSSMVRDENELLLILRNHVLQQRENDKDTVVHIDEEVVTKVRKKEKVRTIIWDAIENDRVEVFFQPIMAAKENIFASAEVLARIRKEDGTIIMPGVFIEVAEEYGLIKQLGERVFEKACQFIKKHELEKYGVRFVEINLSVVQCENWKLAGQYIDIMKRYGMKSSFINLEITETASIKKKTAIQNNMDKLLEYGVTFSLDDFGDGHSNLNYITDMPFENVKLDMKMVKSYFQNEKAKIVLESAVKMIHEMGIKVIAEGVETETELEGMITVGVDYIQGYYYSRPLSSEEYLNFLKKNCSA